MDPVYRVRPWASGWGVFADDRNVSAEPFRLPADAVIHAKELARATPMGAQILVYDEGGVLVSEFFHGPEERSSLDRDDTTRSIAASIPGRKRVPSGSNA